MNCANVIMSQLANTSELSGPNDFKAGNIEKNAYPHTDIDKSTDDNIS